MNLTTLVNLTNLRTGLRLRGDPVLVRLPLAANLELTVTVAMDGRALGVRIHQTALVLQPTTQAEVRRYLRGLRRVHPAWPAIDEVVDDLARRFYGP